MALLKSGCRLAALVAVATLSWGCSGGGGGGGGGGGVGATEHSSSWPSQHGEALIAGDTSCSECHGSDFSGGSAEVACASCHGTDASPLAGDRSLAALVFGDNTIDHPSNWESLTVTDTTIPFYTFDAARHGHVAKEHVDFAPVGFEFCASCHTGWFNGRDLPSPPLPSPSASCVGCHDNDTPHSPNLDEWREYHHITTRPENSVVCGSCHSHGNNSPLPPPTPDLSTTNNCFNGQLCHTGSIVTTPIVDHFNNHWEFHQKSPEACRICHGENFQGQGEAPACFSCHNGNKAPVCTTCHDPSVLSSSPSRTGRARK